MRWVRIIACVAAPLLLNGCLLSPGKFAADMTLTRGGGFTFAYKGEIYLLGLGQLAAWGASLDDAGASFTPSECYGEPSEADAVMLKTHHAAQHRRVQDWNEDQLDPRECTENEIAAQRQQWEEERDSKRAEDARNLEIVKALLGGIDPSSPDAIDEFTARVRKQKGWRSIVHKGDGLFDVDFAINGTLDHDFSFPVIERSPGFAPFLYAVTRSNGAVRIDAPGFAAAGAGGGALGGISLGGLLPLLQAVGTARGAADNEARLFEKLPKLDGTFTLRTDAEVLTNNTDDGPVEDGTMRVLTWTITPRRNQAPEALIRR